MWSAKNRQQVRDEFCRILDEVHPTIEPIQDDNDQIIYYDKVALVTMVNSESYFDEDFDVCKPASGVEQLIFGIAKSLEKESMFAWFRTVAQNQSFWTKMSSKLSLFLQIPIETLTSFCVSLTNTFFSSLFRSAPKILRKIERLTVEVSLRFQRTVFILKFANLG